MEYEVIRTKEIKNGGSKNEDIRTRQVKPTKLAAFSANRLRR